MNERITINATVNTVDEEHEYSGMIAYDPTATMKQMIAAHSDWTSMVLTIVRCDKSEVVR